MNLPVPTVISQKETPKKLKGKKGPYRQSLKKTEGEKKAQTVSLSKKLKGKKRPKPSVSQKKLKGKKGPNRQSLKKTEGEKKAQTVSLSKKLKGKKKVQTVSLSDALLHAYGTWAE